MTVTRTRRSLAEQLREALDELLDRGIVNTWVSHYGEPGAAAYTVYMETDDRVFEFTPGECMDFVNEHGYDVVIGKP